MDITLFCYNYEYQKKDHLLILLSRLARYSWEPKWKIILEILWVLFEKISFIYPDSKTFEYRGRCCPGPLFCSMNKAKAQDNSVLYWKVFTLTDLNPRFGVPWDMLGVFLWSSAFIMLQKKSFDQKKIWISCTGLKVPLPFFQNWKIAKMALLNPWMKFKKYFGQNTSFQALWRWHLHTKNIPNMSQIQDLGKSE